MNIIQRDICNLCDKQIYLHDFIVVCTYNNCIYHGKCLNFDNDTVLDIQNISDWYCPLCMGTIFPLFNCEPINTLQPEKCHVCMKYISFNRHRIINCINCKLAVHENCSNDNSCNSCTLFHDNVMSSPTFNPYNIDDCDSNKFFDDNSELDTDILETASVILDKCNYVKNEGFIEKVQSNIDTSKYTSFYFVNIDGMKTNFDEFLVESFNLGFNFDFICFVETNISEEERQLFNINQNYECNILESIFNKRKGSGIAIYHKRELQFTTLKKLTVRNSNFESLGGKLKTDIGFIYILVIYRFQNSNDEQFCDGITKIIESISDKPCLIFGDFNYNCFSYGMPHCSTNHNTDNYVNMFISSGFSPLISKGTRFDRKNNKTVTCIDQFWCNIITDNIYTGVFENTMSDHQPIFTMLPTVSLKLGFGW